MSTNVAGADTGEFVQGYRFANYIDAFSASKEQFFRKVLESDDYYNNNTDYSKTRKVLSDGIDDVIDEIESDEDFKGLLENKEKLDKILKDLKFKKDWQGYFLDTDFAEIRIFQENFPENKIYIRYTDLKNNEKHSGWISIDDLPKYATVPMMFEIRNQIRKIIKDIF